MRQCGMGPLWWGCEYVSTLEFSSTLVSAFEEVTVGLRADTWSKRRTRACAACTSMGREFVGEVLGGVPHGRKVTVHQGANNKEDPWMTCH